MFTINNATPADIEEILKVDRYMPREEMVRKIETRPEQVLVMKEDGKVVGVLRWGHVVRAHGSLGFVHQFHGCTIVCTSAVRIVHLDG